MADIIHRESTDKYGDDYRSGANAIARVDVTALDIHGQDKDGQILSAAS